MPAARHLTAPKGRRPAPKNVWEAVRADYLAGLPAHECCRRHGVTIAALRTRAARNGWRRIDQPWVPANALDPSDEGVQLEQRSEGDLDRIDTHELIFVAHRRMLRCVLRGDAAGALRWRRVGLALEAEEAEMRRATCARRSSSTARASPKRPTAPSGCAPPRACPTRPRMPTLPTLTQRIPAPTLPTLTHRIFRPGTGRFRHDARPLPVL